MRSKRNSAIITAYSLLFTVTLGIVGEDLWKAEHPARTATRRLPVAKVAKATKPASPVLAQVKVASR